VHYSARNKTENSALLLQFLFEEGATFSLQDEDGNTPHHISCDFENVQAMKTLCNSPDGLSRRNNVGFSPGETAASGGHIDIVSLILDQQPTYIDLRATVSDTEVLRVLLEKAIDSDDWEKVQQIATVAGINTRDQEIAFQEAVMADGVSVTRNLLSIGCPLNWAVVRDGKYNSTWFQKALQNHCTRTVSILLENGVSIDGYDDSGWTALHSATGAQNVDAVSRILPRIADRNHRDKDGWSALDLAIWSRNEELRQLLDDGSPYTALWTKNSGIYYPGCNFTTPENVEERLELPTY
jgi:ankyrin repeat protein